VVNQTVTACPQTQYTLSVSGQLAIDPASMKVKPQATCWLYISDSTTGNTSRQKVLNTANFIAVTKTLTTAKGQTSVDVQVSVDCSETIPGRVNTIYLDDISFA